MFIEYEELARTFKEIIQAIEKSKKQNEQIAQEKNLSDGEKMELDHESFAEFGKQIREIREFVTAKYGEKVYFEFCQSVGWGVHNGQYEWVEEIGAIDRSIVPLIHELNNKGFTTKFSCSGIPSEHREHPNSGYIMFVDLTREQIDIIKRLAFKNQFYVLMTEKMRHEGIKVIRREQQLCIYNEEKEEEKIKKKWERFYRDIIDL